MHSKAWRFLAVAGVFLALAGVSACGGDKSGGPLGTPEAIVTKAPDTTLAAGTAQILITAPQAAATGVVDLATRSGTLSVTAAGQAKAAALVISAGAGYVKSSTDPAYVPLGGPLPQVLQGGDPWADIDLVRGTVHILSDGGGEVDGASTIGYTLTVDPQQAIETTPPARQAELRSVLAGRSALFMMDVWIDSQFRIRRIEVPYRFDFKGTTPPTRIDGLNVATDVDLVTFGVPSAPVTSPPTVNS